MASTTQQLLEALAGQPLPEWQLVQGSTRRLAFAPGDYLFRTGVRARHVYVVLDGLVKMVYETADGQEWIKAFVSEDMLFASMSALLPGGQASFSACALQPTVVERLDYDVIAALAERHMAWQSLLARAFQLYGARKEARELSLLTQSAEQRYLAFLNEYPLIAARISQKDLASYIRITPVALSRIKARLRRSGAGAVVSCSFRTASAGSG